MVDREVQNIVQSAFYFSFLFPLRFFFALFRFACFCLGIFLNLHFCCNDVAFVLLIILSIKAQGQRRAVVSNYFNAICPEESIRDN